MLAVWLAWRAAGDRWGGLGYLGVAAIGVLGLAAVLVVRARTERRRAHAASMGAAASAERPPGEHPRAGSLPPPAAEDPIDWLYRHRRDR